MLPFLNMTKQFVGSINQVSSQINPIVMGMAGTERIFNLMDGHAHFGGQHSDLSQAPAQILRKIRFKVPLE